MLPHFLALYPLSIWLKALIAKGFGFVQQALFSDNEFIIAFEDKLVGGL